MNLQQLQQLQPYLWSLPRVPGQKRAEVLLYGSAPLLVSMDDKVLEQIADVASLPGLVGAFMSMERSTVELGGTSPGRLITAGAPMASPPEKTSP